MVFQSITVHFRDEVKITILFVKPLLCGSRSFTHILFNLLIPSSCESSKQMKHQKGFTPRKGLEAVFFPYCPLAIVLLKHFLHVCGILASGWLPNRDHPPMRPCSAVHTKFRSRVQQHFGITSPAKGLFLKSSTNARKLAEA